MKHNIFELSEVERIKGEHTRAVESVYEKIDDIERFVLLAHNCLESGGKVLWCGNGGSAAEAQHMAAELMVRYKKDRKPLASFALTTDTSLLTAHANDYDFETLYARQLEAVMSEKDLVVLISTSGSSPNILRAAEVARNKGGMLVSLVGGKSTPLSDLSDIVFSINSYETARIQEAHTLINHMFCEGLDKLYS